MHKGDMRIQILKELQIRNRTATRISRQHLRDDRRKREAILQKLGVRELCGRGRSVDVDETNLARSGRW